jgi:transposase
MAQAYSNDLRAKLCQAYARGDGSLRALAARFVVSYSWARKTVATQQRTGSADRPAGRPRGFPSRLTPELREALELRLAQLPDATLLELQDWLKSNHKVSVSVQRLSAVLLEMGCRRKKKPARR